MYSALDLAKYIVNKCIADNHPISNLQLQKILYFIQKEFLVQRGVVAFPDDIEAWQFGPVVPRVYYYYCENGAMPIMFTERDIRTVNINDAPIIDQVIIDKRSQSAWKLVNDTHKEDGAWDRIYRKGLGNRDVIPTYLIKQVG